MFYEDLQGKQMKDIRFVSVPINENNHWKVLVANFVKKTIYFVDPFGEELNTSASMKRVWT